MEGRVRVAAHLGSVRRGHVQVLEARGLVLRVDPRDLEEGLELLREADARARVARDVQARQAAGARVLGEGVKVVVLLDAKRARLHGAVVGHDRERAAIWVLRGLERGDPADHADLVRANDALARGELAVGKEELLDGKDVRGHRGVASVRHSH